MTAQPSPGILGFLSVPTCNQDENHFSWVLGHLLNSDVRFRHRFLFRVLGIDEASLRDFSATYQQSSKWSRPDLKIRCASDSGRYLLFVETKVQSPVDVEQLSRHQRGLESESWTVEGAREATATILILIAPRAAYPANLPGFVHQLTWEEIHEMLLPVPTDTAERGGFSSELARVLEARWLADFVGFDAEAWKEYLDMRAQNADLIGRVEDRAGNFVSSVRTAVNKAVLEGKAPFGNFQPAGAARGTSVGFLVYPKAVANSQSHWGHLLVLLDDGQVEASCGTSSTKNCSVFLKAVGKRAEDLAKRGWELWYVGSGIEMYTELSSWKPLLETKVTEISLLRRRDISTDREILASSKAVGQTFEDLKEAFDFLVALTG